MSNPLNNFSRPLMELCETLSAMIYVEYGEDYRGDQVYDAISVGKTTAAAISVARKTIFVSEMQETMLCLLRGKCRLVKLSEEADLIPLD